jgi:hypothetical protein
MALTVSLSCSPPLPYLACLPTTYTGVANTGATGIYFSKNAPIDHCKTSALMILAWLG